jgi:predicted GNAT superfamily acetyltransferase
VILIRNCEGFDELEACVRMQTETWGYDPSDVIPRKAYKVAQKIGGQVLGAFDTELPGDGERGGPNPGPASLVGFLMALPGIKSVDGVASPYLHSHMLAVRNEYRNRGIGVQLKLAQRQEALARGIRRIEWTFDPLEIKNAHLNIHKLGAVVSHYLADFYGVSSSRLQGGLPTDRLLAEWRLDSPRVAAFLAGRKPTSQRIEEEIEVPGSIYEWKSTRAGRVMALAVQTENRQRFQKAFDRGLAVLGFSRDKDGNGRFELGWPTQPELNSASEENRNL